MTEPDEKEYFFLPEPTTRSKPTHSLCNRLGLLFLAVVLTLITGLTAVLIWEVMLSQRHHSSSNRNVTDNVGDWMTTRGQ